jgi:tight adherence protein C
MRGHTVTVIVPLLAAMSASLALAAVGFRRDRRVTAVVGSLSGVSDAERRSVRRALAAIGWRAGAFGLLPGDRLRRKLELSGSGWSVDELGGFRVVLAGGASALGLLLVVGTPGGILVAPILALGVVRGPDLVLARRARRRQSAIEWAVPDLVELLVATTEAGLAPSVALERSSALVGGPLGGELRRVLGEVELGVPWRLAMERLVERTEVPSLRRLAAALARSNRLGTPIRSALRSVAGDLRSDRRARAEELARRAPVKMLFPLVFLILPAFLLLTVGPVVLATVHSLRSG